MLFFIEKKNIKFIINMLLLPFIIVLFTNCGILNKINSPQLNQSLQDSNNNGLIDIDSYEKLQHIKYNLKAKNTYKIEDTTYIVNCPSQGCKGFELIQDIDASESCGGNCKQPNGIGFDIIGTSSYEPFEVIFEGNNYTIENLYILNKEFDGEELAGIFGYTSYKAVIQNLNINKLYIEGTTYPNQTSYIGTLVAYNQAAIHNINIKESTITIIGQSFTNSYLGGVIGYNKTSTLKNITASIAINSSITNTGGMIGANNDATITDASITGTLNHMVVSNYSQANTGGLVAKNNSPNTKTSITHSNSNIDITSNAAYAGGLVAENKGVINDSFSLGNLSGIINNNMSVYYGGFIGKNFLQVFNSFSYSNITVKAKEQANSITIYAGGLIAYNDKAKGIYNSYSGSTVSTSIASNTYSGGLVGYNNETNIENTYATGGIYASGKNNSYSGGLIAYNKSSSIKLSYTITKVIGKTNQVGAFVGVSDTSTYEKCYVDSIYSNLTTLANVKSIASDSSSISNITSTANLININSFTTSDDFSKKDNFLFLKYWKKDSNIIFSDKVCKSCVELPNQDFGLAASVISFANTTFSQPTLNNNIFYYTINNDAPNIIINNTNSLGVKMTQYILTKEDLKTLLTHHQTGFAVNNSNYSINPIAGDSTIILPLNFSTEDSFYFKMTLTNKDKLQMTKLYFFKK